MSRTIGRGEIFHRLEIDWLGPIERSHLDFGDLTVLVGPQASGKSIALQTFKFAVDRAAILGAVERHGLQMPKTQDQVVELIYGEGMSSAWSPKTVVRYQAKTVDPDFGRRRLKEVPKRGSVFYVPAQRAVLLPDGFPRAFRDVDASAPFVSREYSETLHQMLTAEKRQQLFPRKNKLNEEVRKALDAAVFHGGTIELQASGRKKLELFLKISEGMLLPSIAWTAGQREFAPLLLALYPLLPSSKLSKATDVDWVIIEELEMGLHPKAIISVMVLVFELIGRGYRVVLSTHHPAVLDVVWGLQQLQDLCRKGLSRLDATRFFRNMVQLPSSDKAKEIADGALGSTLRVHAFDFPRKGGGSVSQDITSLDPSAADELTSGWGGLTQFSSDINEIVAKAVNLVGGGD